jgi:hypothetical protein
MQKTKLIESILLGIPIPPIFVSQREDGKWDVVDGLQRLGTIFQFVGILRDEDDKPIHPLVLEGTKYLPSLENKVWDKEVVARAIPAGEQRSLFHVKGNPPEISPFTQAQRLFVKRARIGVSIILKESDEKSKYELFQRLNTGGTHLSNQEVRNCLLIMTNRKMYHWIERLAHNEDFDTCTPITERKIEEQYHLALVLRFLVLRNLSREKISNIGSDVNEFLTEEMLEMAENTDFNYEEEEDAFTTTFEILASATGENSFKKYEFENERFLGGFLVPAFETIASGVGYNYKSLSSKSASVVRKKIIELWENSTYLKYGRGGVTASSRVSNLVPLGREVFSL